MKGIAEECLRAYIPIGAFIEIIMGIVAIGFAAANL